MQLSLILIDLRFCARDSASACWASAFPEAQRPGVFVQNFFCGGGGFFFFLFWRGGQDVDLTNAESYSSQEAFEIVFVYAFCGIFAGLGKECALGSEFLGYFSSGRASGCVHARSDNHGNRARSLKEARV